MKYTKFILVVIIILFLSSCASDSRRPGDEHFRTGSEGLVMRFIPNSPPAKIYDEDILSALIEIHNAGATDVSGGNNRLYISGFDPSLITGVDMHGIIIEDLDGKDFDFPDGGYTTIHFEGSLRDLRSRNVEVYEPTLLITACYEYETIANPEVCIDGDPYAVTSEEKVCSAGSSKGAGTQGAPIAVSSVATEPTRGKSRFKITINNVGGGCVFKDGWDVLDRCNPYDGAQLSMDDINYVRVDEVKVGDTDITSSCKPLQNGYLRIKDNGECTNVPGGAAQGSGYMICELGGITEPAYTTPLRIKLSYNYRDSITKRIKIVQTP
jgi:hypothetical protein